MSRRDRLAGSTVIRPFRMKVLTTASCDNVIAASSPEMFAGTTIAHGALREQPDIPLPHRGPGLREGPLAAFGVGRGVGPEAVLADRFHDPRSRGRRAGTMGVQ